SFSKKFAAAATRLAALGRDPRRSARGIVLAIEDGATWHRRLASRLDRTRPQPRGRRRPWRRPSAVRRKASRRDLRRAAAAGALGRGTTRSARHGGDAN